jgi:prepilin-type N-terminal cleavage/methylation domain-containing protein
MRMPGKGYSIIELVVTLVIVGLAAAGVAAALVNGVLGGPRAEAISVATGLCAGEADRVMALSFASVVDQNRGSPVSFAGSFSPYSWQVRVDSIDTAQPNLGTDPAMANYKVVEVRVHHALVGYISIEFLRTNHS